MKKRAGLLFSVILVFYAFTYIATSRVLPCEDDCAQVQEVSTVLKQNRNYILNVYRCSYNYVSDTICVFVKDTTGVDWNALADTACMVATQHSLPSQTIFILKNWNAPPDTLARKICP